MMKHSNCSTSSKMAAVLRLVLVVIVVVSLFHPTAHGFVAVSPKIFSESLERPKFSLHMISQKEKRRLEEGKERSKVYEQAELRKARFELEQELLSLKNKKFKIRQVTKLLKNAQHDGLTDIGIDARLLAMELYYKANRPSDMLSPFLLSSEIEQEENDGGTTTAILTDSFLLWAHSNLKDWKSALPYAQRLDLSSFTNDDTSKMIIPKTTLQSCAFSTFVNMDTNLSFVKDQVLSGLKSAPSPSNIGIVNDILKSFMRTNQLSDAKQFFQEILALQQQQQLPEEQQLTPVDNTKSKTKKKKKKKRPTADVDTAGEPDTSLENLVEMDWNEGVEILQALLNTDSKVIFDDGGILDELLENIPENAGMEVTVKKVVSEMEKAAALEEIEAKSKDDQMDDDHDAGGDTSISEKTTTTSELLNKESYQLALECAAQLGDLELMWSALGNKQIFDDALSDSIAIDNFTPVQKAMGNASRKQTIQVLNLLLTTFAAPSAKEISKKSDGSEVDESLAKKAIHALLSAGETIDPELLSRLIMVFCEEELRSVINSCWRFSKNKKGKNKWYASLSIPAKVRLLPALWSLETQSGVTGTNKPGTVVKSNSWDLLTSLLPVNAKNDQVPLSTIQVLRQYQTYEFCSRAFGIAFVAATDNEKIGYILAEAIVTECWKPILVDATIQNENDLTGILFQQILPSSSFIMDEGNRMDMYLKILIHFRTQLLPKPGKTIETQKIEFGNNRLDLIVHETVQLLQTIDILAASSSSQSGIDLKKLAINVATCANFLMSGFREFRTPPRFSGVDPSDNGIKEALQTTVKTLLSSSNIVFDDRDLCQMATNYYYALMDAAAASSAIDKKSLFFPISIKIFLSNKDASQEFRDCILGTSDDDQSKNKFIFDFDRIVKNAMDSMVDALEDDTYDKDFAPLVRSIIGMSQKVDAGTGINYDWTGSFLSEYRQYFLVRREDLFFDHKLLTELFSAIENLSVIELMIKEFELSTDPESSDIVMINPVGPELIQGIFERLSTCKDAQQVFDEKWDAVAISRGLFYYLKGLYSHVNDFDVPHLRDAYIDACSRNTKYAAEYLQSKQFLNKLVKSKILESTGGRKSKKRDLQINAFLGNLNFGKTVSDMVGDSLEESSQELLIWHYQKHLWDSRPPGLTKEELKSEFNLSEYTLGVLNKLS